jgi:hypothetical protein
MNDKLQFIREKCIAANPEIRVDDHCFCGRTFDRPIRLADVLLAIGKHLEIAYACDEAGWFWKDNDEGDGDWNLIGSSGRWNLRADDLEKQREETINFLYKLLQ